MNIVKGIEYTIVSMPENIAADTVDGLIDEFSKTCLVEKEHSEYLLDMQKIAQLHSAALAFIVRLHDLIIKNDCTLCIAGLRDAVENALVHNLGNRSIMLFKSIIDFEQQKELVFDLGDIADTEDTGPRTFKRKPNVVLMEPNLAFRQNQRAVLTKLGIENVVEAKEIGEVVKKIRDLSYTITLLILDYTTIKLGAAQLIKTITSQPSCAQARVICTAPAGFGAEIPKEAENAGVRAMLPKNFNVENLQAVLNSLAL